MDERCGEPRALPHAARVPAQLPVLGLGEGDGLHRLCGRRAGIRHAVEPRAQLDELAAGEEVVHRLVLRHVPDPPVEARVAADRLAEHADLPLGRRCQARDRAQQRRLARAVRPQQSGHAGLHRERHVAHGHDAAEPLRHGVDRDRRRRRRVRHPRTSDVVRRRSPAPSTMVSPASQSADTEADTGRSSGGSPKIQYTVSVEHLRDRRERERVGHASLEAVLGDAADRRPDEEDGQRGDRRVRAARREGRDEQRERRVHGGDGGSRGEEPRRRVPVVLEPRSDVTCVERVPDEQDQLGHDRRRGRRP